MALFLLPHSNHQSKMDIVRKDLSEVWEHHRFSELNPLRTALIEYFKVDTYPLAPTFRRFKGRFWEELSFWALPRRVQQKLQDSSLVPSPLFGLLSIQDPIPAYSVGWKDRYQGEAVHSFWKRHLSGLLVELLRKRTVFDFTSSEDRKALTFPNNARVVRFLYYRQDKRVINTLPHRAYTLRYIVEMDVGPEDLERINFLDYKVEKVEKKEGLILVRMIGEGRYI